MAENSEVERKTDKGVFIKGKHKRLSNAAQINLSRITETNEMSKSQKLQANDLDTSKSSDNYEDDFESDSRENSCERETEREIKPRDENGMKNGINKTRRVKYHMDTGKRKVYHGYEPECERLSDEGIKVAEVSEKNHVDQVNRTEGSKSQIECEKSIYQKSSVLIPRLDLSSLSSETDSSDMSDTKHLNATGRKNVDIADCAKTTDNLNFFSDLQHTCIHGNINFTPRKGESLHQRSPQNKKQDKTPRKCILCDINGASIRNKAIQTDSDKLLSELIYPYEYYDRYSRANKKQAEEKTKEVISICQPVKVVQKPQPPRRGTPVITAPATTPDNTDKNSSKDSPTATEVKTGEIENESISDKKVKRAHYLYEPRENVKTEFHGHCGSTLNSLVITEHADGQKRTLPGLKGLVHQQRDAKMTPKELVKHSDYNINSLGIQFSLPEYNTALRSRKEPTPRTKEQRIIYTPRFAEQYLPLSRPPTFRPSPRQHAHGLTSAPTDMYDTVTHPAAPVPSVEDIVKSFDTHRGRFGDDINTRSSNITVKTSVESTSSSRKQKFRFSSEDEFPSHSQRSLPPIPSGARAGSRRSIISGPITVGGSTL